jgi:hypothetical protein
VFLKLSISGSLSIKLYERVSHSLAMGHLHERKSPVDCRLLWVLAAVV